MSTNAKTREFLGVGWKFPLEVTPAGKIAMSKYEQSVEEAIYSILSTAKGERVMLDLGAGIHDRVFAPNNAATVSAVVRETREALVKWEPRIDVLDVSVETTQEQPNLLLIRISYRVRANHALGNLVFPFYINERL